MYSQTLTHIHTHRLISKNHLFGLRESQIICVVLSSKIYSQTLGRKMLIMLKVWNLKRIIIIITEFQAVKWSVNHLFRGTGILLIKIHNEKERQNFYDAYSMNPEWKESESRFFTNQQNSQVLAILQQYINRFGRMTQHNDLGLLDSICVANLNYFRKL